MHRWLKSFLNRYGPNEAATAAGLAECADSAACAGVAARTIPTASSATTAEARVRIRMCVLLRSSPPNRSARLVRLSPGGLLTDLAATLQDLAVSPRDRRCGGPPG